MSCKQSVFATLLLAAIVSLVPSAHAAPAVVVKAVIAGSSAMWQSMGLAAYNGNATQGNCVAGAVAPCFHYTSKNFNLNDTRPPLKGGVKLVDTNTIWIVWDSHLDPVSGNPQPNMWAYIKVDSVVGLRCYFARPRCNVTSPNPFPAGSNQIAPAALWGDNSADLMPPVTIQALFTATNGPLVNVAASDIRPEDGLFAMCRANSTLGGGSDSLDGLGYGINPSGACPTVTNLANLVGSDIQGTVSTAKAFVADFNIVGTDPFSNIAIPAFTTVSVGAAPIVFFTRATGPLSGVTNVTDSQLQTVFGGANCGGTALGGSAGAIDAYLREPLSGTMNTTESTVFRYPDASGVSQETGVAGNADNPLNQACGAGGGSRKRGIGTGDVVAGVKANARDAISYAFFSYGNVASIADNPSFRYLTLNGVDPIFHKYGSGIDPGQPTVSTGQIPGAADVPCAGSFPCPENQIWSGKLSFPNLRSGQYRAWAMLRLVGDGAGLAAAKILNTKAQSFVISSTPDFVPALNVGTTDPGLRLLRSHYQQKGGGVNIGVAPINISAAGDKGGDMGGCVLHAVPGTTAPALAQTDSTTGLAQAAPGTECVTH